MVTSRLKINQCQPKRLDVNSNGNRINHRGVALLNEDNWFVCSQNARQYQAACAEAPNIIRRDLDWLDPE